MTRLRTSAGISAQDYEKRFLLPFAPLEDALERFASHNLASRFGEDSWHLTPEGFLVSNSIISDLLLIQEKTQPLGKRG